MIGTEISQTRAWLFNRRPTDSPIEAGLGFVSAAKIKHGTPFLGREALVEAKARPLRRRLLSFTVDAEAAACVWGREGIYRDGMRIGHVTSGGVGFSVNAGRAIGVAPG